MALDGVRALVFDTFGTVVDWYSGLAREAGPFLARHGKPDVDPGNFAYVWRKLEQPAMEEVRSGLRPFERLDVLHREILDAAVAEFGLDPARIPAAELEALNLAWHRLDPWPDSVLGLTRLKAGYIIAPLSNGNVILLLDMAKRAGLPWDAILGAEVARAYKPTREVLPAHRRDTGHATGGSLSSRGAHQRPGGGPGLRAEDGLRSSAIGIRAELHRPAAAQPGLGAERRRSGRTGRGARPLKSSTVSQDTRAGPFGP